MKEPLHVELGVEGGKGVQAGAERLDVGVAGGEEQAGEGVEEDGGVPLVDQTGKVGTVGST